MDTSAASSSAGVSSQHGSRFSLPGVIDPGLDFVLGLVLAMSSGMQLVFVPSRVNPSSPKRQDSLSGWEWSSRRRFTWEQNGEKDPWSRSQEKVVETTMGQRRQRWRRSDAEAAWCTWQISSGGSG